MNKAKISAILLVIITIVSATSFFTVVITTPEQPWINSTHGSFVSNYIYKDLKWSIYQQYNSTQYYAVSEWGLHLTLNFQSIQEVKNAIQSIQSGL
jgi:hypothetical protein